MNASNIFKRVPVEVKLGFINRQRILFDNFLRHHIDNYVFFYLPMHGNSLQTSICKIIRRKCGKQLIVQKLKLSLVFWFGQPHSRRIILWSQRDGQQIFRDACPSNHSANWNPFWYSITHWDGIKRILQHQSEKQLKLSFSNWELYACESWRGSCKTTHRSFPWKWEKRMTIIYFSLFSWQSPCS